MRVFLICLTFLCLHAMGQIDRRQHHDDNFDDDAFPVDVFPSPPVNPSDDPEHTNPEDTNHVIDQDHPDETCLSEALEACKEDLDAYCTIPTDLPEHVTALEWLKRCIHDLWKEDFSISCIMKVNFEWGQIKEERGFDSASDPMASDILEIMTCKKDKGCEYDSKKKNSDSGRYDDKEHGRGEHSKHGHGKHGHGKHHYRGHHSGGGGFLLVLTLGFCLACCPAFVCYRCHMRKKRQAARAQQGNIQTATIGRAPSQVSPVQQSSAPPSSLYPVVSEDMDIQMQTVPATTHAPANMGLHV